MFGVRLGSLNKEIIVHRANTGRELRARLPTEKMCVDRHSPGTEQLCECVSSSAS